MRLVRDGAFDAFFNNIATNATRIIIASDSSTDASLINSSADTRVLAYTALTSADFTISTGDASGRKVTISSHDSMDIIHTGVPDNCYIFDTGSTEILLVTPVTSTEQLTTGGKVNQPAFDDEIADPTS
jgi:hypothetical protein